MFRYQSQNQLSIKEFEMPFESLLDPTNRWVVMSKMIPWDEFARAYQMNLKSRRGAPTIDARIVLSVVIIKHLLKTDDEGVIEMIQENPYMQYFLGLKAFTSKPVMDPSLLVHIRKRIDLAVFEKLTDELIREGLKIKDQKPREDKEAEDKDDDFGSDSNVQSANKGKLQIDATVADADIKYPTDLDMLNDSREKAEELITYLCGALGMKHKLRTYCRNARKAYLNLSKKKRKTEKELRKGIRQQLGFVRRDIKIIHQPNVQPIVRGNAKSKVEFGAKINVSLHDGYAWIDHFDWNAYNE